ncbi:MAG: hypothetical protein QOF00_4614 [Pseudonocardiales bacterium]|jgi:hypothetical protein|nr:hypothetical protein [Pseudonocardiales bacterium]
MPWPVACKPSPGLIKKVTGVDANPGSTSASVTRALARDAAVLTDDRAPVDQLLS